VDGPVQGSGFNGWDIDASNDLTTSTLLSGDVTGTYNATQVGTTAIITAMGQSRTTSL